MAETTTDFKETFEAEVEAALNKTTEENLENTDKSIAEATAAIKAAETQKELCIKNGDITGALAQDEIIKEKTEAIGLLKSYKTKIENIPPLTQAQYEGFAKELDDHYNPLLKQKYTALLTAFEQATSLVEDLNVLHREHSDLMDDLNSVTSARENHYIVKRRPFAVHSNISEVFLKNGSSSIRSCIENILERYQ